MRIAPKLRSTVLKLGLYSLLVILGLPSSGNWLRRSWAVAGVDLPANRYLTFQASYIRQDDLYLRSVNFPGLALLVRTSKPFGRK